jgi:putative iron-dependent peroxidase
VQRWVHDLERFRAFSRGERDLIIGRRHRDNEEIADAPPSAHVKRTAQEEFDPPAFVVRRSIPWASAREQGLEFIAYGSSLNRFERQLRRMAGLDDGITDALFRFSRPITGGYYWCPPIAGGRLDLAHLRR